MQLHENSVAAETHGLQGSNQFSIRLNPKAFEILSAQIYKDRILAPIRELICNAYDAAKENFEVILPTGLNSTFSVRDYGPGLSHDDTVTLYTTYFESTKGHNNDAIGGFGLGSKSPFAYTDQFTVDSYHGGMWRSYVCYRDKGIPTISLISEQSSTERTGLRVSFAVKPEDRQTFNTKFTDFARYVPFKIKNNAGAIPTPLVKLTDNINVEPYDPNYHRSPYYNPKVVARMGIVCYSIDDAERICKFDFRFDDLFQHKTTIIDFPIGAISIAPSRETLSYDEPTKQAITKVINDYREFVISAAKKEFDSIKNSEPWFDQIKAHLEIRRKYPAAIKIGLNVPDSWTKEVGVGKFAGVEIKDARLVAGIYLRYGELGHRLLYLGEADSNTENKVNLGLIIENFFNTVGIKLNCLNYKMSHRSVKTFNVEYAYTGKLSHEFFTNSTIYVIKSKNAIIKPSHSRLQEWYKNHFKTYYDSLIFFNVEDVTKLTTWLNDNIFINKKTEVIEIDYDSYVATPVKRESKPAAVFQFVGGTWNDTTITITEDKTRQHYYVLSDAKYVTPSTSIFKILGHLTPDPKSFIAFPKSRYESLEKKAKAAGWKHYKDYDFSKVDLQILSNVADSWNYLSTKSELLRLLIVLKDAGYKFPAGWNEIIERKDLIQNTPLYDSNISTLSTEFNLIIPSPTVTITGDEIYKLFNADWLSTYRASHNRWIDKQIIQIFKGN